MQRVAILCQGLCPLLVYMAPLPMTWNSSQSFLIVETKQSQKQLAVLFQDTFGTGVKGLYPEA
jgi:hypothetical protein